MNPVRGRVCQRPAESTWTSHRAYLRLSAAPQWLDVERALDLCGFEDTEAGRRAFDEFVQTCDTRHWQRDLADAAAETRPVDLGADLEFAPSRPASPQRDLLLKVVGGEFGVAAASMCDGRIRSRAVTSSRRVLAHIARDRYGLGSRQIAALLTVTEGAVRQLGAQPLSAADQRRKESALRDLP